MKRIKINENITMKGMNDLYFNIEIYDVLENGNLKYNNLSDYYIQSYQRDEIANILHATPIFKMFKEYADNEMLWDDEQCKVYCKKMNDTIDLINKIKEIYYQ